MVGVFVEDRGLGAGIEHDAVVEGTVPEAGRHGNDVAVGDLTQVLAQADKMSVPENFGTSTGKKDLVRHFYESFLIAELHWGRFPAERLRQGKRHYRP